MANIGKAQQSQKKSAQPKSETSKLLLYKAVLKPIWTYGDSLQFQPRNPPALPIKDFPVYSECSFVCKQLQDPCRLPNEHSEIKSGATNT
jgi:hypothetical protein